MSDEVLRQALFPFQHQAQLANAVTGLATCFGGIMPLLFCRLYRPQPRRWMLAYLCILITGIPTVSTPLCDEQIYELETCTIVGRCCVVRRRVRHVEHGLDDGVVFHLK